MWMRRRREGATRGRRGSLRQPSGIQGRGAREPPGPHRCGESGCGRVGGRGGSWWGECSEVLLDTCILSIARRRREGGAGGGGGGRAAPCGVEAPRGGAAERFGRVVESAMPARITA